MDQALYLLFGRARAAVLGSLHQASDAGVPLHLRELARRCGLSPTAVQYELRLLSQLNMLKDVGTQARPLYVLDRDHALFSDLHALFAARGDEAEVLRDDAHFARKRVQQRRDKRGTSKENSPFLRHWGALAGRVKVA